MKSTMSRKGHLQVVLREHAGFLWCAVFSREKIRAGGSCFDEHLKGQNARAEGLVGWTASPTDGLRIHRKKLKECIAPWKTKKTFHRTCRKTFLRGDVSKQMAVEVIFKSY